MNVLLRLLPESWRHRWSDEIQLSIAEELERIKRERGRLPLARAWIAVVWDVVRWSVALRVRRRPRAPRPTAMATAVATDVRYALRTYWRNPVQSLVILGTLGGSVGLGATAFSAVDSILLRPLPLPDPHELVVATQTYPNASASGTLSWANFADLRRAPAIEAAGAALGTRQPVLAAGIAPFYADAFVVSTEFFEVFGVRPVLGRFPQPDLSGKGEAVIAEEVWTSRIGRDPNVIGEPIAFGTARGTIVGVLPAGTALPRGATAWMVADFASMLGIQRTAGGLITFARIASETTLESARAQVAGIAASIAESEGTVVGEDFAFHLTPLHEQLTRSGRETLILLSVAVAAVFLVTCANVAGIRAAQFASRRRELAVRSSLGAGLPRLAGQLLTENCLLALGGAAVGIGIAWLLSQSLNAVVPASFLLAGRIEPDWRVVTAGISLALLAGALGALLPLIRLRKPDFAALRAGAGSATRERRRTTLVLLIPQYALSLATLAITGLLIRSLLSLGDITPGFETEGRIVIEVDVPTEVDDAAAYQRELAAAVAALPGVSHVGFAYAPPLATTSYIGSELQTAADAFDVFPHSATWRTISPNFFATMGIPLLAGRPFSRNETGELRPVLVSRALADRYGGASAVVGVRMRPRYAFVAGAMPDDWLEIIGVVADVADVSLEAPPANVVYTVDQHNPGWTRYADMIVATEGDPTSRVTSIVDGARSFDPNLPIGAVRTYDEIIASTLHAHRFRALVLSGFAVATWVLVAIGVYGATAHSVQRRGRELAVRTALGAEAQGLVLLAIREAAVVVVVGTIAGIALAVGASTLVRHLLYDVSPSDPATLAGVLVMMAGAVLVAGFIPARRAARADPALVLRGE